MSSTTNQRIFGFSAAASEEHENRRNSVSCFIAVFLSGILERSYSHTMQGECTCVRSCWRRFRPIVSQTYYTPVGLERHKRADRPWRSRRKRAPPPAFQARTQPRDHPSPAQERPYRSLHQCCHVLVSLFPPRVSDFSWNSHYFSILGNNHAEMRIDNHSEQFYCEPSESPIRLTFSLRQERV